MIQSASLTLSGWNPYNTPLRWINVIIHILQWGSGGSELRTVEKKGLTKMIDSNQGLSVYLLKFPARFFFTSVSVLIHSVRLVLKLAQLFPFLMERLPRPHQQSII